MESSVRQDGIVNGAEPEEPGLFDGMDPATFDARRVSLLVTADYKDRVTVILGIPGLSKRELKVCLALIECGWFLNTKTYNRTWMARIANIPRTGVSSALHSLVRKGVIRIQGKQRQQRISFLGPALLESTALESMLPSPENSTVSPSNQAMVRTPQTAPRPPGWWSNFISVGKRRGIFRVLPDYQTVHVMALVAQWPEAVLKEACREILRTYKRLGVISDGTSVFLAVADRLASQVSKKPSNS